MIADTKSENYPVVRKHWQMLCVTVLYFSCVSKKKRHRYNDIDNLVRCQYGQALLLKLSTSIVKHKVKTR